MAYSKTTWLDRAVEFVNRYTKSGETSTEVTLVQSPGTITQAGTPLNATNLNKLEQGVADALPKDGTEAMTGNDGLKIDNGGASTGRVWEYIGARTASASISQYVLLAKLTDVGVRIMGSVFMHRETSSSTKACDEIQLHLASTSTAVFSGNFNLYRGSDSTNPTISLVTLTYSGFNYVAIEMNPQGSSVIAQDYWYSGIRTGASLFQLVASTSVTNVAAATFAKSNIHLNFADYKMNQYTISGESTTVMSVERDGPDYTLFEISAPQRTGGHKEATLVLMRQADPTSGGVEFTDIYDMGYTSEKQVGIRIQKRGTGVYRDWVLDYYDGTTKTEVIRVKPNGLTNFSGDVTVSKASPLITVNATSGNPVFSLQEAGSLRGYIGYNTATDTLSINLVGADGVTVLSTITMNATGTFFTDALDAPGGTFSSKLNANAGLGFGGGDFTQKSLSSNVNWGAYLRGSSGALGDAAIVSADDNTVLLVKDGGVVKVRISGTEYNVFHASNSPSSLATNGYQKFASGVIIQWGRVSVLNGNPGNVTFPIAFPTACQSVQLTVEDSGTSPYTAWLNSRSASGFTCRHNVPVEREVDWIAIGY